MKLYYAPGACSLADHIALAESGLPYALSRVDLKAKTTEDGGDYNAINPKGYVPALDLGQGIILTENIAILSYIADRAGAMVPREGLGRFRTLELLAFISTELHKNFKPFHNPAASDAEKDEAAQVLDRRFATLAQTLGDRAVLIDDTFSLADCYAFVMLTWADKFDLDLPERLVDYRERLKQRPAVQCALSEEGL
jgi:glutathione S-transferase